MSGGNAGLPIMGVCVGRVMSVTPVAIHGDVYYDAHVELEPLSAGGGAGGGGDSRVGGSAVRVRLASHACAGLPDGQPTLGQRLSLQVLMGQVTRAELAR